MSVYNGAAVVEGSVRSVLGQKYSDLELIIVDDGSSDATPGLLKALSSEDRRITVMENRMNSGLTASLNKGIRASAGKYTARIDAGDRWMPGKLEEQVRVMENDSGLILLGTQGAYNDGPDSREGCTVFPVEDACIRQALIKGINPFIHSSVLFKAGYFYNEGFPKCQDLELWTRLFFAGKLGNLDKPLVECGKDYGSLTFSDRPRHIYFEMVIYEKFITVLENKYFGTDSENREYPEPRFSRAFNDLFVNIYGKSSRIRDINRVLGKIVDCLSFLIYPRLLFYRVRHKLNVFINYNRFKKLMKADS